MQKYEQTDEGLIFKLPPEKCVLSNNKMIFKSVQTYFRKVCAELYLQSAIVCVFVAVQGANNGFALSASSRYAHKHSCAEMKEG